MQVSCLMTQRFVPNDASFVPNDARFVLNDAKLVQSFNKPSQLPQKWKWRRQTERVTKPGQWPTLSSLSVQHSATLVPTHHNIRAILTGAFNLTVSLQKSNEPSRCSDNDRGGTTNKSRTDWRYKQQTASLPKSGQTGMKLLYVHRNQSGWTVNLTTHHHLRPRLRMAGAITPLNPHAFMAGMVTVSFQFIHFQLSHNLFLIFLSLYCPLFHFTLIYITNITPTSPRHPPPPIHTYAPTKHRIFPRGKFFWTIWPWRWRHYDHSKRPTTQRDISEHFSLHHDPPSFP